MKKNRGHEDEGEGRCRRVVQDAQELRLDHVSDHAGVGRAEEFGVHVVAGRRDEGQQRAGDDTRHRQREGDLAEGGDRPGVQIAGRLVQPPVDALQRGVERQDHERQEVVRQTAHDRERCGEDPVPGGPAEPAGDVQDVQRVEDADDRPGVREDRLPGEGADQEAGEERRDHQDHDQVPPAAGAERDQIGQRIAQHQAQDRGGGRVEHRAQELRPVLAQRVPVGREVPGDLVALLQGARLHGRGGLVDHRQREEDEQPEQSGQQQPVRRPAAPLAGWLLLGGRGGQRRGRLGERRHQTAASSWMPASMSWAASSPKVWAGLQCRTTSAPGTSRASRSMFWA